MWEHSYYKETGKAVFLANYWPVVGVTVLYSLLMGNESITARIDDTLDNFITLLETLDIHSSLDLLYTLEHYTHYLAPYAFSLGLVGLVVLFLVAFPYEVGMYRFFLESSPSQKAPFSRVGFGFSANYGNVVLTGFLQNLYLFLWTLLFIIPGIIRSFGYFAVPFILAENPNLDHSRVIRLSLDMTQGYKWNIFCTQFSFIGWMILNALTFGILGVFYVNPYYCATQAEMYRALRKNALSNGIATQEELPGVMPPLL